MNEWMNKQSKKNILNLTEEIWELGKAETRYVVYNCVKCMMKIG